MKETPINRPVRPEKLVSALKRNMARRKAAADQETVLQGPQAEPSLRSDGTLLEQAEAPKARRP